MVHRPSSTVQNCGPWPGLGSRFGRLGSVRRGDFWILNEKSPINVSFSFFIHTTHWLAPLTCPVRAAMDLYFWCENDGKWDEKTTAVCAYGDLTERELDFLFPKSSRLGFEYTRNVFTCRYNIEVALSARGSINKHVKRALELGFRFRDQTDEDRWNARGRTFRWDDVCRMNGIKQLAMRRERIEGDGREGAAVAAAVVPGSAELARAGEQVV